MSETLKYKALHIIFKISHKWSWVISRIVVKYGSAEEKEKFRTRFPNDLSFEEFVNFMEELKKKDEHSFNVVVYGPTILIIMFSSLIVLLAVRFFSLPI